MRLILRWLMVVVACCVVFLGEPTAFAGNPLARPTKREARDHLDRGNGLYNTRSFDQAIIEFKAGALVEPAPVFDYNLGQAYRQLGKYQDALWHYDRFLNYGKPTGELLDAVNNFMAEMRAQLANRALTMPPTGLAPSTDTSSATPNPDGPPLSGAPPSRTGTSFGHASHETSTAPVDHNESPNWLGWTTTGVGVVAVGTAGFLLLRASSLNDQADTEPDTRARNDLKGQARTRNLLGAVIGVGGLVLTTTGVIMLVTRSYDRDHARTASLDVGISGQGVIVFGRF